MSAQPFRIGCAGWSLRPAHSQHFPGDGTHLSRYAATFNAVEINSSFHRPHRTATYERWASSVPDTFRFSVKLPKEITHVRRLRDADEPLDRFLEEVSGLGGKLGPILVQLPPKFEYEPEQVNPFIETFRSRFSGGIAWEPRHPTWFSEEVNKLFGSNRIARVAADPEKVPGAGVPAGWAGISYFRLHGSPRVYYSKYSEEFISDTAVRMRDAENTGSEAWCIFDNTTVGAATENALTLKTMLSTQSGQADD